MPLPEAFQGDFEGVKDSLRPLTGSHEAKVEDCVWVAAKPETEAAWQAGNDGKHEPHPGEDHPGMLKWTFAITSEGNEKRKAWKTSPLTPEGRGILYSDLIGLGYTDQELNAPDFAATFEPKEQIGKPCRLMLAIDKYDETQHYVKRILTSNEVFENALA